MSFRTLLILFSLFIFVLLFFNPVSAIDISEFFNPRLPPDIKCGEDIFTCLGFFLIIILKIIIAFALALSTIFIAYAGILYITKGGEGEKTSKIKNRIIWAAVGLIIALMAFAFVQFIESVIRKPEEKLFIPQIVFAQEIVEPSVPQQISCGPINLPSVLSTIQVSKDVWKICMLFYINRALSFVYVLALALGVIFLAWAGILYITNPEKSGDTHKRLMFGIIGIIIAILSFTIVKMIDLFFLKL